jgi:hypothetical protein
MTGRPPPPARTVPARGRRGLRPSAPPPLRPCTRGTTLGRCRRYNTSPRRLCERALFWEQKREGQEVKPEPPPTPLLLFPLPRVLREPEPPPFWSS